MCPGPPVAILDDPGLYAPITLSATSARPSPKCRSGMVSAEHGSGLNEQNYHPERRGQTRRPSASIDERSPRCSERCGGRDGSRRRGAGHGKGGPHTKDERISGTEGR